LTLCCKGTGALDYPLSPTAHQRTEAPAFFRLQPQLVRVLAHTVTYESCIKEIQSVACSAQSLPESCQDVIKLSR
jgi:hypothetical protein